MKLVFLTDHKFIRDKNDILYTTGQITREYLSRYIPYFSKIIVLGRESELTVENKNKCVEPVNLFSERIIFKLVKCKESKRDMINSYCELIKLSKKEIFNCDFIIFKMPNISSIFAVKYVQRYKKPYLIELVGCPWDALWNHSLKGKIIAPYMYFKTKKLVKDAKYVVYVTNEFLQKRYPTEGKYVNCSDVVLKEFDDNVLMNRLNKINTMKNNNKIVLGTIAAVDVRYKGQQYVIRALGKLKKQGITNYEYQLVGGGDQTYLKSVAEKYNVTEQVKFLGTIPHDKVFEWLDTIDIYVQPSSTEGLPRALIEAMSRGLPAFGSNVGGIPELLDSKFIFSKGRKKVDEICNILQSFDQDTMREQARRNYEEAKKYDSEIIEERRRKFFEKFIEENKKYKS
ncbi:MAG: glycosyltransferase [Mollicutes bacterium]|nr:glycosyltransferase [Mollicutes bacterium]